VVVIPYVDGSDVVVVVGLASYSSYAGVVVVAWDVPYWFVVVVGKTLWLAGWVQYPLVVVVVLHAIVVDVEWACFASSVNVVALE